MSSIVDPNKQKEIDKEDNKNGWENKTSGNKEPSWYVNIQQPIKFGKLTDKFSSSRELIDVAIIGGGIAGMTTAYLLSKSGKKVVVIEDGYISSGETGRTTAHITHALDDRYYDLEQIHGKQGAHVAAESHTAAINLIESIVNEEKIDCDFERLDGFLFLDPSDKKESLDRELQATHRAGIKETEILERVPLSSFNTGPCIRFPRSRLWPQFNKVDMKIELAKHNIEYIHIVKLGGRRKEKDKPHQQENDNNYAWKNKSFRAYADYMSTEEFQEGISELLSLRNDNLAEFIVIMCAEALPWRCHRRLINDYLSAMDIIVYNIIDDFHKASLHKITSFASFKKGKITYPESNN